MVPGSLLVLLCARRDLKVRHNPGVWSVGVITTDMYKYKGVRISDRKKSGVAPTTFFPITFCSMLVVEYKFNG